MASEVRHFTWILASFIRWSRLIKHHLISEKIEMQCTSFFGNLAKNSLERFNCPTYWWKNKCVKNYLSVDETDESLWNYESTKVLNVLLDCLSYTFSDLKIKMRWSFEANIEATKSGTKQWITKWTNVPYPKSFSRLKYYHHSCPKPKHISSIIKS